MEQGFIGEILATVSSMSEAVHHRLNQEGEWQVRAATWSDLETIVRLNCELAWESEGKQLDAARLRQGVAAVLTDASKGRYFVAEQEGAIAGQVMMTWEWSDWRNGWFWWLQSVYVKPEHRRRGVLRSLVKHLEGLARQQGDVVGLRLYVEKRNCLAQSAYARLGFREAGYHVLEIVPWPSADVDPSSSCKTSQMG